MKKYGEDKHYSEKRPYCRFDIINYLIEKNNYVNYLEIGVRAPQACFNRIIAEHKDGVDPVPLGRGEVNYPITSDEFFDFIKDHDIKYDIIFVDGLHVYEQAKKDVLNSLNHLTDNGSIIMHDCNPPSMWHQRPAEAYDGSGEWNGTAWKAYVELRCFRKDLSMSVIDTDYGVGVIQFGKQEIWKIDDYKKCIEYEYLDNNRKRLLNLISPEEFEKIYPNGRCTL
tara:strand:+ start:58 stop:732 length:675 start_codon:yes stop_codon:yes gene_type:complete